jgi:hypothetical protein
MTVLALVALLVATPPLDVRTGPRSSMLTPEQAERLAEKLAERKPYAGSAEARSEEGKRSMGMFFVAADYQKLKGNPVFGYWSAGGFKWSGNHIAWDGVASLAKSCRGITKRAWDAAFAYVAEKHGLVVDRSAPMRMRGACVDAVTETTMERPVLGVVMEMRLDSPTGAFRWRYSRGNPTIEGAVGASIELPILLAPKVNQPGWPRDEQ